jgi:hypothetical protein
MISRTALVVLVSIGSLLPVVLAVVLGTARLLAVMDDAAGAAVLDRIGLALAAVWGADLVALLLALGVRAIEPRDRE